LKCIHCGKLVPITKTIQNKDDAISCVYCSGVIPSEIIVWSDGLFHFNIMGDVTIIKVAPQLLQKNQTAQVLDLKTILAKSRKFIFAEPNIKCICREFGITESDIRVELILEPK